MITNKALNKRFKIVLIIEIIVTILILYFSLFYKPNYYTRVGNSLKNINSPSITNNTTRVYGKDFHETAISISQLAYPSTFQDNRPNCVVLVREDKKEDGILASRLIHSPINAPILYINKNYISKNTLDEIKRLNPKGIYLDRKNKVIVVGEVSNKVKNQLGDNKIKFRNISGKDVFELGKNIDDYLSTMKGNHKDNVVVIPISMSDYALVQSAWSSRSGDGLLFIDKDSIPKPTLDALKERYGGAYIYILGDENAISNKAKRQLLEVGHVQKVPGKKNIYSQSVGFAVYKDIGKNFSWWIDKNNRNFGWGITEAGHNFIFANPENWQEVISASVLAHNGKCGPIILVNNKLESETVNYLESVRPMCNYPQGQIYNHGWIIGNENDISKEVQSQIDEILEYK